MKVEGPDISKYGVIVPDAHGAESSVLVKSQILLMLPDLASIGRYVLTPDIFQILRGVPKDLVRNSAGRCNKYSQAAGQWIL